MHSTGAFPLFLRGRPFLFSKFLKAVAPSTYYSSYHVCTRQWISIRRHLTVARLRQALVHLSARSCSNEQHVINYWGQNSLSKAHFFRGHWRPCLGKDPFIYIAVDTKVSRLRFCARARRRRTTRPSLCLLSVGHQTFESTETFTTLLICNQCGGNTNATSASFVGK